MAKDVASLQLDASSVVDSPPKPEAVEGKGEEEASREVDVQAIREAPAAAPDDVVESTDS